MWRLRFSATAPAVGIPESPATLSTPVQMKRGRVVEVEGQSQWDKAVEQAVQQNMLVGVKSTPVCAVLSVTPQLQASELKAISCRFWLTFLQTGMNFQAPACGNAR